MSEQPNDVSPPPPDSRDHDPVAEPRPTDRGRVRTDGETSVDDALGAADDPR